MITDKDMEIAENIKESCCFYDADLDKHEFNLEECVAIISGIRAKSAEQARIEERIKTIEEVKSRLNHAMPCYAFSSALDKMIENTILGDSVIK